MFGAKFGRIGDKDGRDERLMMRTVNYESPELEKDLSVKFSEGDESSINGIEGHSLSLQPVDMKGRTMEWSI
jgi:hypothetical protein